MQEAGNGFKPKLGTAMQHVWGGCSSATAWQGLY